MLLKCLLMKTRKSNKAHTIIQIEVISKLSLTHRYDGATFCEDLDMEFHGLSNEDLISILYRYFRYRFTQIISKEIISRLEEIYREILALNVNSWNQKKRFQKNLNQSSEYSFDDKEKLNIYERLNSAAD